MVYDSMTLSVAWDSEIILSGSILDFDKSDMHTLHRDDWLKCKRRIALQYVSREPQKESLYSCV